MKNLLNFDILNFKDCEVFYHADLKNFSTFHIGGKAKYLFIVNSLDHLVLVCYICKVHNIKYKVIGYGSNLLFNDNGYNGAIIVNRASKILIRKNSAYVNSGTSLGGLINTLISHSLSGLENLSSIPSTIGGAITNNTGAFGREIKDLVEYVDCIRLSDFKKIRLSNTQCKFAYRNSIFKSGKYLILRVKLNLFKREKTEILADARDFTLKKFSSQPTNEYSAGSVFKRTLYSPARLIDELGLKGKAIGGAMVSNKHAGFIVNFNNARASEVKKLIHLIKREVKSKYNLLLFEEIEFVD